MNVPVQAQQGPVIALKGLRAFSLATPTWVGALGLLLGSLALRVVAAFADAPWQVIAGFEGLLGLFTAAQFVTLTWPSPTSRAVPDPRRSALYVVAATVSLALALISLLSAPELTARDQLLDLAATLLLASSPPLAVRAFRQRRTRELIAAFFDPDGIRYAREWVPWLAAPTFFLLTALALHRVLFAGTWTIDPWADRYCAESSEGRAAMRQARATARDSQLADAVARRLRGSGACAGLLREVTVPPWTPRANVPDRDAFDALVADRFFEGAWPEAERSRAIGASDPNDGERVTRVFTQIAEFAERPHVRRWAQSRSFCGPAGRETDAAVAWFRAVACTGDRAAAVQRYTSWIDDWLTVDSGAWRVTAPTSAAVCVVPDPPRWPAAPYETAYVSDPLQADAVFLGTAPGPTRQMSRCDHFNGTVLYLWLPSTDATPARWAGAIARGFRSPPPRYSSAPHMELVQVYSNASVNSGARQGYRALTGDGLTYARRALGGGASCTMPSNVSLTTTSAVAYYLAPSGRCP